jgi:hypothetical protein
LFYRTPMPFTGLARSVTGQVWSCFFSSTFIHCFGRSLLIVCPIDPIILLLASLLCWDHVYAVGKCFHHLVTQRLSGVLNSEHRPILAKNFIRLSFTPTLPVTPSVLQLVSKPVRSLVVLNRLCDLKVTWRKTPSSLWFTMMKILVAGRIE